MTEKLYDIDSYITEFNCKVISLYSIDDATMAIELDRTAFFPEGGGQSSDRGFLGEVYVENVEICDGHIRHLVKKCDENVDKLQLDTVLHGKIDWKKRFSDMQQHSGEHIVSGIVHTLFGYDNVGFHLSANEVTLDFNGVFTEDELCKVENLVNEAIWNNLEIKVSYPSEDDLSLMNYRSKKELNEAIRIVEIPGVDVCACCAPHVRTTGEIGAVRIVSSQHHRGGTRLNILCGERLMLDSRQKLKENYLVSNLLAAKETETFAGVKRLKDENQRLSWETASLKKQLTKLRCEAVAPSKQIVEISENESGDELLLLADMLSEKAEDFAAVFSGTEQKRFVIISKTGYDVNSLCKEMSKVLSSRGGGRNGIVQGTVTASEEEIRMFLDSFIER